MGTTLTGTTPQDTYDSLIKVTDNGPLSGTAKYLSDGLGNDSVLALSTAAAEISAASGAIGLILSNQSGGTKVDVSITENTGATIDFNEGATARSLNLASAGTSRLFIASTGNVGIGTSAPTAGYKLDVAGRTKAYNSGYIADFVSTESNASTIQLYADNTNVSIVQGGTAAVPLTFFVGGTEKMRIQTGGGISFNGDTAAANALDDYEEGTFTPTFNGTTRTGGTLLARYTKIGRLVHFDIFLFGATFSGSSGPASILGFPFTSNASVYGQGLISYNNCVDGNTNGGYVDAGATTFFPVDENSTSVASFIDGTADRNLMISGSYTV